MLSHDDIVSAAAAAAAASAAAAAAAASAAAASHTAGEVESPNARDSRGQQMQTRSRREGSWQEMRGVMDRWSSVERAAN